MDLMRRWARGKRGQSLVELSLVIPVFFILVLGVLDFGRVFFAYVTVTNAARNGVDYAAKSPDAVADLEGIRDAALSDTNELIGTSTTNPEVFVATGTDSQGRQYAEVTVDYTFNTLFPWPMLPTSVDVERTVRARVAE